VIYDGKVLRTYNYEILSNKSVKPVREFKIKLIDGRLFPSCDCKAIFGLTKNFDVVELDPLNGEANIRLKDIRRTFDEYDMILEETEDFKTLTSSKNGTCVAVISWNGVLVDKKGEIKTIKGIEHKEKYTTERYVRTEINQWGGEQIITKTEEHFYYENAHINSGTISPDCKSIALTEDILFKRCYAAVYSLGEEKYIILRDVPYGEPIYEGAIWSYDSKNICFFYRYKELNFGVELFKIGTKKAIRTSLNFPVGAYDSSPIENKFAFYDFNEEILILDASKSELNLERIAKIKGKPLSLKWSPCGKYLLAVNEKKRIFIINLENREIIELKGKYATWFSA